MSLFGTSGIRDLCPEKIDAKFAFEFGQTVAKFSKKIVIGFDGRPTGQMLLEAAVAGASEQKATCYNLGICSTPTLCYYSKIKNALGIMITASHNPLEYNGFKIFEKGKEATKKLENKVEQQLFRAKKIPKYFEVGKIKLVEDALEKHLMLLKKLFDVNKIRKENIKLLVDCANLATSISSPKVLESFGVSVIKKNCEIGKIPDRNIEPNEQNLKNLALIEQEFDFAIAHDGDGDRAVVLDQNGKMLGLDLQLAMAVDYILKKTKTKSIVLTVESSLLLKDIVKQNNAKLYLTAVGSRAVAEKMRQTSALFGGEPCGEYIFAKGVGCPDGLATALLFCQIFAFEGGFENLKKSYKTYPIKRIKLPANKEEKKALLQKLEKNWPFKTKIKIDGLRAQEEWGWILVRPSGTENYIRITIEAYTKKELEENLKKVLEVFKCY
ncbi:MAG: hypothetical protein N3D10_01840 [Candidatus Micrarchaeota archaeon]|nr:hypothetical protein [Candidatus Micrarchaeota archaeon]